VIMFKRLVDMCPQ